MLDDIGRDKHVDDETEGSAKYVESGLVAVVRAKSSEQAARTAEACAEGGVAALEITFTVPGAADVISDLVQRFTADQTPIGAGRLSIHHRDVAAVRCQDPPGA
jgi:2-keto-3-deoxy-6-phosphogluconate aldolase